MDFDKFKSGKLMLKSKLDKIVDKLFSGKINKKDLKQNFLLNISLLIRHLIVTHKNLVTIILIGFTAFIILTAFLISSHEKNVNEANKHFEMALFLYRKTFIDKDLSPEERVQSLRQSIGRFQYVINQFGRTSLKYDSIMYQANAYFELMDYNNALKKYQELIDKKSSYYFADLVLINIGKCHEQLNNIEGAISAYQKVIDDYPRKSAVAEAKFQLAKLKDISNNMQGAIQDYQNLISAHPQNVWAGEARRRILFLQSIAQKPQPQQTQQQSTTPQIPQTTIQQLQMPQINLQP